jgi:hypothetical protein
MTTQAQNRESQQEQMGDPQSGQAAFALFGMLSGSWAAQVLLVGTELGIPDALLDGPKNMEELAKATETHTPSLTRLVRALVSLGILAEQQPGQYSNTPLSLHLCKDTPGSMREFLLFFSRDWSWSLWNELLYAIKTGKSAMRHGYGMSIWEYVDSHPEDLRMLNVGIDQFSTLINPTLLAAYDFSAFQSLIDIGGGYGNFLKLLAANNPAFHGTLLERPAVIEAAKEHYAGTPFEARVTLAPGNCFEELPAGRDAYFYKFVLNDWGDDYVRQTLMACRRAIPEHGKLLIAEFLLTEKPDPISTLMNVVTFLGFEGGHGRTEEEFRTLLQECGFTLTRVVPTASSLYIVEGVPS